MVKRKAAAAGAGAAPASVMSAGPPPGPPPAPAPVQAAAAPASVVSAGPPPGLPPAPAPPAADPSASDDERDDRETFDDGTEMMYVAIDFPTGARVPDNFSMADLAGLATARPTLRLGSRTHAGSVGLPQGTQYFFKDKGPDEDLEYAGRVDRVITFE